MKAQLTSAATFNEQRRELRVMAQQERPQLGKRSSVVDRDPVRRRRQMIRRYSTALTCGRHPRRRSAGEHYGSARC